MKWLKNSLSMNSIDRSCLKPRVNPRVCLTGCFLGMLVLLLSWPAIANETAIIHELQGSAKLLRLDRPAETIQLNQKLRDGNILEIADGSLVEITYSNGCGERITTGMPHKVDSCGCLTSPFRRGIRDNFNATLTAVQGEILIFQGEKYVPAETNMRIRNGDRILAMRNSSAVISYDHGCLQNVEEFSVLDVDGCRAPCPPRQLIARSPDVPLPQTPAPLPPSPVPAAIPPTPLPPTPLIPAPIPPIPTAFPPTTIAVIASLGVTVITDDNDDDDSRAVSP